MAVNALASDNEPLADYLKRREREKIQRIAAIRGLLAPEEKQLEEIRQAMKAIGIEPSYVEQLKPFLDQDGDNRPMHGLLNHDTRPGVLNCAPANTPLALLSESLTIKEMIMGALNNHFHLGATPSD